MTIGTVNMGTRSHPATDEPMRWISAGLSAAGDVTVFDFGRTQQDVPIYFRLKSDTQRTTLKTQLETTSKPWGLVSVTPDANDDLGIGASGAVNLYYVANSFKAQRVSGTLLWHINVLFRKYA